MEIPRAPSGWTVVTPSVNVVPPSNARETPPFHPANGVRPPDYHHMASPYPVHPQIRSGTPSDIRLSPVQNAGNVRSASSLDSHRYGGYNNSHPPPSYRGPIPQPTSKVGHALDLGLRNGNSDPHLNEEFSLPPIHAPDSNGSSPAPYSLPPISSMEDARGTGLHDSAAVLRRLRLDDDGYDQTGRFGAEDRANTWGRRHSLSTHPSSSYVFFNLLLLLSVNDLHFRSKAIETSPRFKPYNGFRSHQDPSVNSNHSSAAASHNYHGRVGVQSDTSQYSHEGDSTSNPSPISPTTPTSSLSSYENPRLHPHLHPQGNVNQRKQLTEYPDRINHQLWSTPRPDRHGRMTERPETISVRRNSSTSDGDSNQPHRPW